MTLEDLELRLRDLDQRLRPIADRPVDITKPGWAERLRQSPPALDQAGVRRAAQALLTGLIASYQSSSAEYRQAVRKLFAKHSAFAWAASMPVNPATEDGFRQQLVLFSMKDQGRDSRDALLELQELCSQARAAGVNAAAVLSEVAQLSSNVNKYGMGSTKAMLLNAAMH